MSERFLPYTQHQITPEDAEAVVKLLGSGQALTQGPAVEAFEQALCDFTGAPYAVAVNSGTAALHLAYGLLFQAGQRIRMPAISFVATANAALYCGLQPEFLDVSPQTGLVMEDCEVGVELGGQPTGHRHLIVDACHSVRYDPNAYCTILSLHPAKHLCAGEGGVLLTGDAEIARRARLLRSHGRDGVSMVALGFNYRLPDMNAALALSQLSRLDANIAERQRLAARYQALLTVPCVPHPVDSHRHLFQALVEDRDNVQVKLKDKGIGTAIHYPVIPDQPYYRKFGDVEGLVWARAFAKNTLSLPLFPGLTEPDQDRVIEALR